MDEYNWVDLELDDAIGDEMIYTEEGREALIDDGEISPVESAFMEGYDKAFD